LDQEATPFVSFFFGKASPAKWFTWDIEQATWRIQMIQDTGKNLGAVKVAPVSVYNYSTSLPTRKPDWLRVKCASGPEVENITGILRTNNLHTVCESANCPNMGECFRLGTATFMIMGEICTRSCPFCKVGHGRPLLLDQGEPKNLARAVKLMSLKYAVITSVTRDDLDDGGSGHFARCIEEIRRLNPSVKIEILVPDFCNKLELALDSLGEHLPDVFNHNLETVPRLYHDVRPGSDYLWSLHVLRSFGERFRQVPTKSGLMVGLGETLPEIIQVMKDLRESGCEMLTIGQYLRPSSHHLPVQKYITPEEFDYLKQVGLDLGFSHVESGPLVRSSYHADVQAKDVLL
jgi:lipoyl synthase